MRRAPSPIPARPSGNAGSMYVRHLSVTDFRSYDEASLDFEPGVTALVGPNGQGKTNQIGRAHV